MINVFGRDGIAQEDSWRVIAQCGGECGGVRYVGDAGAGGWRKEIGDAGTAHRLAGVAGEFSIGDGRAVDEELPADDGSADRGIGGYVDDRAGAGCFEHGEQFGGDVTAESGVGFFEDARGRVVEPFAHAGGGFFGRQVP